MSPPKPAAEDPIAILRASLFGTMLTTVGLLPSTRAWGPVLQITLNVAYSLLIVALAVVAAADYASTATPHFNLTLIAFVSWLVMYGGTAHFVNRHLATVIHIAHRASDWSPATCADFQRTVHRVPAVAAVLWMCVNAPVLALSVSRPVQRIRATRIPLVALFAVGSAVFFFALLIMHLTCALITLYAREVGAKLRQLDTSSLAAMTRDGNDGAVPTDLDAVSVDGLLESARGFTDAEQADSEGGATVQRYESRRAGRVPPLQSPVPAVRAAPRARRVSGGRSLASPSQEGRSATEGAVMPPSQPFVRAPAAGRKPRTSATGVVEGDGLSTNSSVHTDQLPSSSRSSAVIGARPGDRAPSAATGGTGSVSQPSLPPSPSAVAHHYMPQWPGTPLVAGAPPPTNRAWSNVTAARGRSPAADDQLRSSEGPSPRLHLPGSVAETSSAAGDLSDGHTSRSGSHASSRTHSSASSAASRARSEADVPAWKASPPLRPLELRRTLSAVVPVRSHPLGQASTRAQHVPTPDGSVRLDVTDSARQLPPAIAPTVLPSHEGDPATVGLEPVVASTTEAAAPMQSAWPAVRPKTPIVVEADGPAATAEVRLPVVDSPRRRRPAPPASPPLDAETPRLEARGTSHRAAAEHRRPRLLLPGDSGSVVVGSGPWQCHLVDEDLEAAMEAVVTLRSAAALTSRRLNPVVGVVAACQLIMGLAMLYASSAFRDVSLLVYATLSFAVLAFIMIQAAGVTQALSAVLAPATQSSSPLLRYALARNGPAFSILLASSRNADAVSVLGSRVDASVTWRLVAVLTSLLLVVLNELRKGGLRV